MAHQSHAQADVSKINPGRRYNTLELFAGAGGLALGLEKSGFESAGLVEFDRWACQTLRKNRPGWNVIEEDIGIVARLGIRSLLSKEIDIDVVSGGYPCQAFSYAGRLEGLADTRGTLFYHYASLIEDLQPKMFLAENVRGLVSHDKGRTLTLMLNTFSEIGYDVQWRILNANDYETAQKRERIAIVGLRKDLAAIEGVDYAFPEPLNEGWVLRDVLKNVPDSEGAAYPDRKRSVLAQVPVGGFWRHLPEEVAKAYMGNSYYAGGGRTGFAKRLSWDDPSPTLTCSPAQKQTERCHPDETRPLTVREYARIQGFPDDWQFEGSMANAYKQIGNAVPVNLGKALGLSLIRTLNQIEVNYRV